MASDLFFHTHEIRDNYEIKALLKLELAHSCNWAFCFTLLEIVHIRNIW